MADMNLNVKQTVSPTVTQRTVLLGRVKMANAIQMPESEWAKLLNDIERDPLFQDIVNAQNGQDGIIRYRKFGNTRISGQFYEMQDSMVVGSSAESPETLLSEKKHLIALIEKIGQENFEKYFLYRENGEPLSALSQECGITQDQAQQLQDFILDMSVQAEFFFPTSLNGHNVVKPTLVGRIVRNEDGTYSIAYYSPHLARGVYEINHNALRKWQKAKKLDRAQAARVRKLVGILELSNLKQGAFWRVIEFLLSVQKNYLDTQDLSQMAPVSLREVARRLHFAPSTISRVLSRKSVLLPWEHEILLAYLMPGQRQVILSILEKLLQNDQKHDTDAELARKIQDGFGIKVSRRTITACRHVFKTSQR